MPTKPKNDLAFNRGLSNNIPPSDLHVTIYLMEKGASKKQVEEFLVYCNQINWRHRNGNLIQNWKAFANEWIWLYG